jgi:hypothetical protein
MIIDRCNTPALWTQAVGPLTGTYLLHVTSHLDTRKQTVAFFHFQHLFAMSPRLDPAQISNFLSFIDCLVL